MLEVYHVMVVVFPFYRGYKEVKEEVLNCIKQVLN